MGTWNRNFLVRHAEADAVRSKVIYWLERKGFDQSVDAPLFDDFAADERYLCLVSNQEWTIVLYSEAFLEGDRLLEELRNWRIIMEVTIADSDIWRYDLFEDGELTASFNSNPRYFGGNDQKLPQNGDPERLCRVLGLRGREADIRQCQRTRLLFSDFPCRSFCLVLGASAGALHPGDFDFRFIGSGAPAEIAGWRIEPLRFERRRPLGEEPPGRILHSLAVRQFEVRDVSRSADPDLTRNIRQQVQAIRLLFLPFILIGKVLGPVIGWWLRRKFKSPAQKGPSDPLLDWLSRRTTEPVTTDGEWLLNRHFGIRIRTGVQIRHEPKVPFPIPNEIFTFHVADRSIMAIANRPEWLRNLFTLRNGRSVLSDELFFVGDQPARATTFRVEGPKQPRFDQMWFVEFERFVVSVGVTTETPLTGETLAAIQEVVQTLGRIPGT